MSLSEAPSINHLIFIDDILIFYKASTEASKNLLRILNLYAQASGQYINTEITTMVFSKNVCDMDKIDISTMWGCKDTKQYGKYLSLSPMIGHSKR